MNRPTRQPLVVSFLTAAGLLLVSAVWAQPPARDRNSDAGVVQDDAPPAPAAAPPADTADSQRDADLPSADTGQPDQHPSQLDTDLLRRLLGERPGEAAAGDNPLERAVRGMRSAHERIAGRDTGAETREIQQQVIDDLAQLIDFAKQSPPPRQNQSASQSESSQQNSESENQPDQQDEPQPDEGRSDEDGESQAQQPRQSDQARESAPRDSEREARQAELNRRQFLVDGVWGHLPPSVRNKILSSSGDEYLQDYEHLARRYFEALAEESTRR